MNEPQRRLDWEGRQPSRQVYDWDAIAEDAMTHPMRWGLVFDHGRVSVANAIRQDNIKAVTSDQGFEVKTENNTRDPVRMCTLWLRYNPDKDTRKET
jgi:hypothetical protein